MERRWPAQDIADYIRLIDDPTHTINEDGTYHLSEAQARAILDLRLQRLTQLGVKEVTDELEELAAKIKDYLDILRSRDRIMGIISDELREVRELFAVPRRTEIAEWSGDMEDEDLIEREDMVVTVTQGGYTKRTPLADFRSPEARRQGAVGRKPEGRRRCHDAFRGEHPHAVAVLHHGRDGLQAEDLAVAHWRADVEGQGDREHPADPDGCVHSRRSCRWMCRKRTGNRSRSSLRPRMGTCGGTRFRNFANVMRNGKIAMKLPEGVSLVNARISTEDDDVMLVTAMGRAIRFPTTEVRVFKGRDSTGVRGIKLAGGDRVVSMSVIRHFEASHAERAAYLKMRRAVAGVVEEPEADEEETGGEAQDFGQERYAEMSAAEDLILTITAGGMGKLSSSHDYPVRGRGGQGVMAMDKAMRGGKLVASFPVQGDDQIMLATSRGQSIRVPVDGISFRSRAAGGVKVFNTGAGEEVVSVAWIADQGEADEEAGET